MRAQGSKPRVRVRMKRQMNRGRVEAEMGWRGRHQLRPFPASSTQPRGPLQAICMGGGAKSLQREALVWSHFAQWTRRYASALRFYMIYIWRSSGAAGTLHWNLCRHRNPHWNLWSRPQEPEQQEPPAESVRPLSCRGSTRSGTPELQRPVAILAARRPEVRTAPHVLSRSPAGGAVG